MIIIFKIAIVTIVPVVVVDDDDDVDVVGGGVVVVVVRDRFCPTGLNTALLKALGVEQLDADDGDDDGRGGDEGPVPMGVPVRRCSVVVVVVVVDDVVGGVRSSRVTRAS